MIPSMDAAEADEPAPTDFDWKKVLDRYHLLPRVPAAPIGDELPSLEERLATRPSLAEYLTRQVALAGFALEDRAIATRIVGDLDADGRISDTSLEEIATEACVPFDRVERVLQRVQQLDPVGVASRSARECLIVQARHRKLGETVTHVLQRHLRALETKNYAAIARDLDLPVEDIARAAALIATLDPWPARAFAEAEPVYVTPDVYVHEVEGRYFVVLGDDGVPGLKIANYYRQALADKAGRSRIKKDLDRARMLLEAIATRRETIRRLTESIVNHQRGFFDHGIEHLKPLTMHTVAADIRRHESTVSRACAGKYVQTPRGIFELRWFFGGGVGDDVASQRVREKIRELVLHEDRRCPTSDQQLAEKLHPRHARRPPHRRQVPRAARHPARRPPPPVLLSAALGARRAPWMYPASEVRLGLPSAWSGVPRCSSDR
jgi:RNA polymerase sigma-54 factor